MIDGEKIIEVPIWVLDDIYDALRIHRNNMIDEGQKQSCLWRMTNKAMNLTSCYMSGKATDENIDKIIKSYISGKLLDF